MPFLSLIYKCFLDLEQHLQYSILHLKYSVHTFTPHCMVQSWQFRHNLRPWDQLVFVGLADDLYSLIFKIMIWKLPLQYTKVLEFRACTLRAPKAWRTACRLTQSRPRACWKKAVILSNASHTWKIYVLFSREWRRSWSLSGFLIGQHSFSLLGSMLLIGGLYRCTCCHSSFPHSDLWNSRLLLACLPYWSEQIRQTCYWWTVPGCPCFVPSAVIYELLGCFPLLIE